MEKSLSNATPEISVVIPALNEAAIIRELVERIDIALADATFEVIVVDDGSTDGTSERLLSGQPHWRVLRHDRPGGQSAAIHTGVLAAAGTLVVTLDADGQNPPEEIPKLLAVWAEQKKDRSLGLIAGQRIGRNDTLSKRWASRAANAIRGRVLKDGTRDTGCGLKAIRRDVFLALPYFDHMHRFFPALVIRAGFRVAHVDVLHAAREAGQSKYSNWQRALVGIVDLIGVSWLIRRRKRVSPQELTDASYEKGTM